MFFLVTCILTEIWQYIKPLRSTDLLARCTAGRLHFSSKRSRPAPCREERMCREKVWKMCADRRNCFYQVRYEHSDHVRRTQLRSVSAVCVRAAKIAHLLSPSSFPKSNPLCWASIWIPVRICIRPVHQKGHPEGGALFGADGPASIRSAAGRFRRRRRAKSAVQSPKGIRVRPAPELLFGGCALPKPPSPTGTLDAR